MAELDLYRPRWTSEINQEWLENLLKNSDIERETLERTVDIMNETFPEANITGYENLIESFDLPDSNDRHVLASAVRINADLIVTNNIKDFPISELDQYDIEAQVPDLFIRNLIDLDKSKCCQVLQNLIDDLTSPPLSKEEILKRFKKIGLKKSSAQFRKLC